MNLRLATWSESRLGDSFFDVFCSLCCGLAFGKVLLSFFSDPGVPRRSALSTSKGPWVGCWSKPDEDAGTRLHPIIPRGIGIQGHAAIVDIPKVRCQANEEIKEASSTVLHL